MRIIVFTALMLLNLIEGPASALASSTPLGTPVSVKLSVQTSYV